MFPPSPDVKFRLSIKFFVKLDTEGCSLACEYDDSPKIDWPWVLPVEGPELGTEPENWLILDCNVGESGMLVGVFSGKRPVSAAVFAPAHLTERVGA